MIGFYDYTVILTYIGFASGITGMFCTTTKHLRLAVFFLALSGLCDMFDGKIARTKKNRTAEEKSFGIQIDSLCDMVCFGVLPIMICFKIGMRQIYSMVLLVFYGLAGVIRLGYFNVMEERRQEQTDENREYYQGLPITSMAMVLPLFFLFSPFLPSRQAFVAVLHILVALVGSLFVIDFKMRKLSAKELFSLAAIVTAAAAAVLFIWRSWYIRLCASTSIV